MTAIKNRRSYICQSISFRNKLTSLSTDSILTFFFMKHYVTAIKNRRSYISLFFGFQDNLTIFSINVLPGSSFVNFWFAPQTKFSIYIFFNEAVCGCNQKPRFLLCLFSGFQDRLTIFSINVLPGSNFVNFCFAPQTKFLIYIFFNEALCGCNQKPQVLHLSLF